MNNNNNHGVDNKISLKSEGQHILAAKGLHPTIPNHTQIDGTEQYKAQLALQKEHAPSVFEKMGAVATEAYNFFFPTAHANPIPGESAEQDKPNPLTVDDVMDKYVDKDSGALQEAPPYQEQNHSAQPVNQPNQKELAQNEGGIQFDDGSTRYPLGLVQAGFLTHGLTNNFFQNEDDRDLRRDDTTETHSTTITTVDLQITKVDDHGGSSITGAIGTAIPGQCITYTITVTNLGPDSVFGATVSDQLPSQLMFWEVVGTNGFIASGMNGGSFTDYSVNLASGESVVYTVKALVDPCASPCDTMINTATVQAPEGVIDTNPNNNIAVDKDKISGEADLKVIKYDDHGGNSETGAVGCVVPGTCITYTVVIYNCGPAFVCGAEVKDILPHDLLNWNVVGSDGFTACGAAGGSFTDIINIAAGCSVTYTITGTVAADAACCDKNGDGGENQTFARTQETEGQESNCYEKTITNIAMVSVPECYTDTNPCNNIAVDKAKLHPEGDLKIVKYDDHGGNSATNCIGSITPGTCITYTIVVSNCGPSDVCGAIVKDCLPDALVNWTVSGTNGFAACGWQGGSFADNYVNIAAGGSVTYTITGTIAADAACSDEGKCCDPKDIQNVATVEAPCGFTDTNPCNNIAIDKTHLTPQVDLSVVKLVDGKSCETISACCNNKELTYTITVSNCGPSDACGVIVTDKLPCGLVIDSICAPNGTSYDPNTGVWTIGKVDTSDSITLTIKAHVVIPTVNLDFTDDTDTSHVYAFKTGQSFESGNTLNLANANGTISVTPHGFGVSTNYDLSHFTAPALPEINYDPVNGKTEALVFDLGESATKATIEASKFFPAENGGDGEYGVLTAFDANGHEVGKVYFGPAENGLPSELNGATFIAASFDGSGSVGTFSIDSSMFCGASFQYLAFTSLPYGAGVINNAPDPTGSHIDSGDYYIQKISYTPETTTIVNTAVVTSCTPDTNPDNDTSSATVKVENPHGDLSVVKYDDHGGNSATGAVGCVIPGTCITYTIVVSNCGPSDVCGAIVKDCLPEALQNWEVCGSNGFRASGCEGGTFTDCVNIEAGCTVTYTIKGIIAADAACNDSCGQSTPAALAVQTETEGCEPKQIQNKVTVTGPACFVDTNPSNNIAVDKDHLKPEGDLKIEKFDDKGGSSVTGCIGDVVPGTCITYTIVVSNCGPSDVCGAIVKDCLPAALLNWEVCGSNGFQASGCEGGSFTDYAVNIEAGCQVTYTIKGTVAADAACADQGECCDDKQIVNTASVSAPCGFTDTNPYNNVAVDKGLLKPEGDLSVVKYDNHGGNSDGCIGEVKVGDCITYSIVVTNSGPSDACGAILTDCLPKELLNWTVCGPNGFSVSGCQGGSFIDCVTVPAGCSVTYTITGTVGQDWGCDNHLSNTASILAPECFNDTNACNNSAMVTDVIKQKQQYGCTDQRDDKCHKEDQCDKQRHDDKGRDERRCDSSEIAYCGIGAAMIHPKDQHEFNDQNKNEHKPNRDDNRHADNNQQVNHHCNDNHDKEHNEQQNSFHHYGENKHHNEGAPLILFGHDQLKDFNDKKDHDNDDKRDNKHADKNNNHHGKNQEHVVADDKHCDEKQHEGRELHDTDKNHTQHFASYHDEKDHCEQVGDNKHPDHSNNKDSHDCNDKKHCGVQMSDNHNQEEHGKGNENDCHQQQVGHRVDGILCGVVDDHGCKGQLSLAQMLCNQQGDKDHELGKALEDINEQAKHKNECQTDQHNMECAEQAKAHDKISHCLPHEHQVLSQMVEQHEMQQQAAHH